MNKIILSVGSDDNYLNNPHLQNYFKSIRLNSNFDRNILVYMGNDVPQLPYENIDVFNVKPESVVKMNNNHCLQHGEFLNTESFDEFLDSDVIVFTDGDMTLQRKLTEEEIMFYRNLKDDDVYVGYNQSPVDTLKNEYFRLRPIDHNITNHFKEDLEKIKVYNTGVMGMNKKTWAKLKNIYVENFYLVEKLFGHYAKQQWLISYIIGTKGFNIIEMGYDIHNHTHYPSPQGTTNKGGLIKYNDKVVLFKHRWF